MTTNEYQKLAGRTLKVDEIPKLNDFEVMLSWCAIGLAGESGEVMEYVKKTIFHQKSIDKEVLKKELGDVLWYVAAIATLSGFKLEDIMQANIDKLKARYPNGFEYGKAGTDTGTK